MPPDYDVLVEFVRQWAAKNGAQAKRVRVEFTDGEDVRLWVPPGPPVAAVTPDPDPGPRLNRCQEHIIALLDAAGRRMTTDQILKALQEASLTDPERLHGDSTVMKALADLTQAKQLLTNTRDGYGRGYGLTTWT